jgi:hypothetical protein
MVDVFRFLFEEAGLSQLDVVVDRFDLLDLHISNNPLQTRYFLCEFYFLMDLALFL